MAKSTTLRKTARGSGPAMDRSAPIAADDLNEWLVEAESEAEPTTVPSKKSALDTDRKSAVVATAPMEPVLERLLGSKHKSQFLLLADWFEAAVRDREPDVCVESEFGDIRFEVIDWIDTPGFLKLVVNRNRMPFEPRALVQMRIRRRGQVYHTTCVSPLSPMFGDLPFAELILIVDSIDDISTLHDMEKNARIEPGVTPSAVSGKPSTGIDNEEPVADGEKAASVRASLAAGDFDVSREDEEG